MIRYFRHEEIDKARWDAAIDRAANGIIYAQSWYLDVVSPNWDALVEEDYRSVMPLPWRKKWGINYLYKPFVTQQLGVFSEDLPFTDKVARFLSSIPKKFLYVDIQLNTNNLPPEWCMAERLLTHHVDLHKSHEELAAAYNENRKRDLKKAIRSHLKISEPPDTVELMQGKQKTLGTLLREVTDHDWRTLSKVLLKANEQGVVRSFLAIKDGQTIAGDAILLSGKYLIFLAGFTTELGKQMGATTFIFDHITKTFAGQPLILDFEGSMIPGVARFFKSLGGVEVPYWRVTMNRLPWPLKLFKR